MRTLESPTFLREQVVALARELGFDICRFANAAPPEHADAFRDWLEDGADGEMTYLARNAKKRCDPQQVLPGAKSVIVLALNYFQGDRVDEKHGRIARYAWGEDYHQLIETKLNAIDQFLRKAGGVQKCYVDTGPMLERDHAASAGIGWHGKSTMLLNRDLGTWFFLAEILTTLDFAPNRSQPDTCGTCTQCIQACPTGAITAPHHVDARRCISYLTIELKGSIPAELRPLIGNRIYGCDDCLAVCPWNRFAREGEMMKPHQRTDLDTPGLNELLKLDDAEFKRRFAGTPM